MDGMVAVRGSLGIREFLVGPPRSPDHSRTFQFATQLGIAEPDWRFLLAAEDIVCAETPDNSIAGVQMANHYPFLYDGDQLRHLRAAMNVLCNRFKLSESSIAFGSQSVIVPEFGSSELRHHLLRSLLRTIGFRYRHLFSFCPKDNPLELQALQVQGWRCFQEEDDRCYLMLDVAKALRGLASQLVLRVPPRTQRVAARATGTV
ncbi:MAG: hypothetical protein ACXVZX_01865 [Terriglobales bacterium]